MSGYIVGWQEVCFHSYLYFSPFNVFSLVALKILSFSLVSISLTMTYVNVMYICM